MKACTLFSTLAKAVALSLFVLPLTVAQASEDTEKLRERGEIDTKHLWATEKIFPSVESWEAEYAAVEKEIDKLAALKGTLSKGPAQLLKVWRMRDEVEPRVDRVSVYARLLSHQDMRVGENQALNARARTLAIGYREKMSWMDPEVTAIPFETIQAWMKQEPGLELYRQAFDDVFRQKKHILSEREMELLAMAGQVRRVPQLAYSMLANADIKFPTIQDEHGNTVELDDSAFYLHMRSGDRKVRKNAYEAIVGTYAKYRNTAAALLNGAVQSHILTVKARDYEGCLSASLDGGNIPVGVYNTLVRTVNDNLHLLHRYQTIRKRVLNLEDGVHAYDFFAPLITDQNMEYTYEEGVETILTALKPLGQNYVKAMRKGFESRWVDVYPNPGKRSGAYSSGTFLTQPYILLNFHDSYDSVSTLAHEMGHSMHSYFSRGTQPYVYSNYSIFCAEVTSTCNEILLQDYMLKRTTDPKKRLYLICEFLEGFRGTVFRQTMFSEFEQHIHELAERGVPLTADKLGEVYGNLVKTYYGPDYTHDDLVDNYWIRIPHFYYNFYVYKYATSYCAASNIARRILGGEPGAVEAYMSFLKGGSSKYPIDMLKMARVDMTSPKPIEDAMKRFEQLLDTAEELLKEIG